MPAKLEAARKKFGRPLTLTEKIFVAHLDDFDNQAWSRGEAQLSLRPDRVAMQDATGQMALLQFIQANKDKVSVASTLHCDHLIRAQTGAADDVARAIKENEVVYNFLSSASEKYGIGFYKPGAGIIHQVVLENYAFPGGLMIGTDSHTPNAGGLGMLAIGVGGADAGEVMAGLPWEVLQPKLIGIKLTGKLNGWASPKDVILYLCGVLTASGGTNQVLEYFGPGVESISCTGKGTITNMGAELGATTSVFPFDKKMAEYLRATGRADIADLAEQNAYLLQADPETALEPAKYYDKVIEIDLSKLEPSVVGPHSPDVFNPISKLAASVKAGGFPAEIKTCLIGSCTNSSYEDIGRAANIARQGLKAGLKARTKFLITPGSAKIYETVKRDGLLEVFEQMGGTVMANACGPCIGQWKRDDVGKDEVNSIVSSFNRNFPGRNDGSAKTLSFITSPEIVTALAFSGSLAFNPLEDSIDGLKFLAPTGDELPSQGFAVSDDGYQSPAQDGSQIKVSIPENSDRLQILKPFPAWDGKDFTQLPILIKTKGKTTTDHISPAGPWLKYRGHLDKISDNMFLGANNAFCMEIGKGNDVLTGEKFLPIAQIARHYKAAGLSSIVIGDTNYGEGSSREHAAMSPRYLGVKVILAKSFARIHETNLKKQGVLPLTFAQPSDYDLFEQPDRVSVIGLASLKPGQHVEIQLHKQDGTMKTVQARHSLTEPQINWFKAGSALNALK